ncbi:outer membrane protein [Sphingomonas sp. SRS2]|uniref:outer membrane protein n=1 Tax=Sphingomonas sp. SRS2 TaxID=133190 RepID=UPI0006184114|nr:outer membrane beta-barrel protein [Sphingomonas sp. SRS2]KKC24721.1 opacity protein and related surface antigens-like protein [Sphingomonas sp. SRS2]
MKKYVLAAALAAGFAAPAMAQDNAAFTGFRVEALLGYDNVNVSGLKNPDGVLFGVGIGYDLAVGGVVVGLEADATDSTSKFKLVGPDIQTDRDLYIGGRVGTVVGSGLLYVKAGYTNARLEQNGSGGSNGDGVRAGLGYEYALSGKSFVKAEYRYSNYEAGLSRNQAVAAFGIRF